MLPAGGFAEPFGIDKSSRPWRQILPQAKFPRQLHLHPAVTYVYVSSLGCKFASLGGFAEPFGIVKSSRKVASPRACKSPMATVFDNQRLAKTPWRQILPLAKFPCCGLSHHSDSLPTFQRHASVYFCCKKALTLCQNASAPETSWRVSSSEQI